MITVKPVEGEDYTTPKERMLKDMIIDLKTQIFMNSIPEGHCPYVYYMADEEEREESCDDTTCEACKKKFTDKRKALIREEVEAL